MQELKNTQQLQGNESTVSIIPLGGLGEIGLNMMLLQHRNEMIVIDAGLMFPEEDMHGINLVIPDMTYLLENKELVKAVVLTHGHEDHIGALPFLLRSIEVPVYGTPLTIGLVDSKLREYKLSKKARLIPLEAGESFKTEHFHVELIGITHSIVGGVGLAIQTPLGSIIHTGDFKLDQTPMYGESTQFHRFALYGAEGVLLLLSDSTNAGRKGYTPSEKVVGDALGNIFQNAKKRIIIACFASHIHRIQHIIDIAHRLNKKVIISGKSMITNVNIALELGYLHIPEGTLIKFHEIDHYPPNGVVILTTGSQGEPMSALSRMAVDEYKQFKLQPGDTVIISARIIPGNERSIARVVNHLFRKKVDVLYGEASNTHVSGHASQEELKLMINLVRPKYFVPIHGEYRHLAWHAQLAESVGIPPDRILLAENGDVIQVTKETATIAGKVHTGRVFVDGKGIGATSDTLLRDRQRLADEGIVIIGLVLSKEDGKIITGPEIASRGFMFVKESTELIEEAKQLIIKEIQEMNPEVKLEVPEIEARIRSRLTKFFSKRIEKRPMISLLIMEL
jgi:ribonuclease J